MSNITIGMTATATTTVVTENTAKVMKSGYSKKSAAAIVASASRNASKSAKRANPKLKKVKTAKKKK